ncbi:MAG: acetyl-CoA acetyltransferase, partial [Burkholderiaceae bacterium]|nr:acetyl-CoA acetyltransferase [Burkholderiaceae bacterium]
AAVVGNAAAAVATGLADCVVVMRSLAQGQHERYGQAAQRTVVTEEKAFENPYGVMSPAQRFAMKVMRFMHEHGVRQEALRAVAMASYHHAQNNPLALMHGRPLDEAMYAQSRWITEPFHLYDCCMENDGAAALVIVPADRAPDLPHKPCYLLGVAAGSQHRCGAWSHNAPDYASASFGSVAPHLYDMARVSPADVDVLQCYENFTGGVVMAMVEHGLCKAEEVNAFMVPENLYAQGGKLPLNTSGGNMAECYMHGLGLVIEGVRQVRGTSTNQLASVDVSMVIGGPMTTPVSSLIFGSGATL